MASAPSSFQVPIPCADRFARGRVLTCWGPTTGIHRKARRRVADATNLTDAERAKLEARRERLMKLMKEDDLDADDRADLEQEWNKLDQQLNRR